MCTNPEAFVRRAAWAALADRADACAARVLQAVKLLALDRGEKWRNQALGELHKKAQVGWGS